MPTIKAKKRPVIKKGKGYAYVPAEFQEKHKVSFFHEANSAEEILAKIKPLQRNGYKYVSIDTETHPFFSDSTKVPEDVVRRWVGTGKSANPQDYPFCFSICDGTNAYSIYDSVKNGFKIFKALEPILADESIDKIIHNAKFDMHMFANAKVSLKGRIHDTIVLAKLADENRNSFALRDIAAALPEGIVKFEYMVDSYKSMSKPKITDYRDIPRELMNEYANADVWNCMLSFLADIEVIEKEELVDLYLNELASIPALYEMERYGMRVDTTYEQDLKEDLQKLTDEAEASIYEEAGTMFNINSSKQLFEVLINMGVQQAWISFTEKGNPSLDKKALQKLADIHNISIVQKILEYRKYEKLLSTYAVGIYTQRDSVDKVHSSINQTEATTGRMSITKPALQTLPKKDKRIRRAFIPSDGFSLYFMDLDQIEYRLFAHYAKAQSLIEAIKNGHDVHSATAAIIFNKKYEDVKPEERDRGKTMNFSLIYGQGNEATAAALKVPVSEAVMIKADYFNQIPEAKPFIMGVHRVIKLRGYVRNFYGRRRRLKTDDCYKAPNALIQGCAADYIKHKMVLIYNYLKANNYLSRMINIVHDELVIEVHNDELHILPMIRTLLSDFGSFRVPITAGVEKGCPSWGQKEETPEIGFVDSAAI